MNSHYYKCLAVYSYITNKYKLATELLVLLGYKPAMECCEAKLLEAKNEPAVLSATDVQCLTFCNFTLADDLETTLKKIPDLSNLQGFLRDCGSSHYLSKFATCWGNLTANRG